MINDLSNALHSAGDQLIDVGIGVLQTAVVVTLTWLLNRWCRAFLGRTLARSRFPQSIQALFLNVIMAIMYLAALVVLLSLWGFTLGAFVTAISVGTLVVALGFQTVLQSVVAGYVILTERPFEVGDRIRVRGDEGTVQMINLRSTVIMTDSGDRLYLPNSLIFTDPVVARRKSNTP